MAGVPNFDTESEVLDPNDISMFVNFMKDSLSAIDHEENDVVTLCRWISILGNLYKNVEELHRFCSVQRNPLFVERVISFFEVMQLKFRTLGNISSSLAAEAEANLISEDKRVHDEDGMKESVNSKSLEHPMNDVLSLFSVQDLHKKSDNSDGDVPSKYPSSRTASVQVQTDIQNLTTFDPEAEKFIPRNAGDHSFGVHSKDSMHLRDEGTDNEVDLTVPIESGPSEYPCDDSYEVEEVNYGTDYVQTMYGSPNVNFFGSQPLSSNSNSFYSGIGNFSNINTQYQTAVQAVLPPRNISTPIFLPRYFSNSGAPSSSFYVPAHSQHYTYPNLANSPPFSISYENQRSVRRNSRHGVFREKSTGSSKYKNTDYLDSHSRLSVSRQNSVASSEHGLSKRKKNVSSFESYILEIDRIEKKFQPPLYLPVVSEYNDEGEHLQTVISDSTYDNNFIGNEFLSTLDKQVSPNPVIGSQIEVHEISQKDSNSFSCLSDNQMLINELQSSHSSLQSNPLIVSAIPQSTINNSPQLVNIEESSQDNHLADEVVSTPFEGKLSFVKVLTGEKKADDSHWRPIKSGEPQKIALSNFQSMDINKIDSKNDKSRRSVSMKGSNIVHDTRSCVSKVKQNMSKRAGSAITGDPCLQLSLLDKKDLPPPSMDPNKKSYMKSRKSLKPQTDKDGWTLVPTRLRCDESDVKVSSNHASHPRKVLCSSENGSNSMTQYMTTSYCDEDPEFMLFNVLEARVFTPATSRLPSEDGDMAESPLEGVKSYLNNFSLDSRSSESASNYEKPQHFFVSSDVSSSQDPMFVDNVVVGLDTEKSQLFFGHDYLRSDHYLSYNKSDVTGLIQSSISSWSDEKGQGDSEDQHFNDEDVRKSLALEEEALMLTKKIQDLESNSADVFCETESEFDNNSEGIDPHEIFIEYAQYISQMSSVGDQMDEMERFQEMLSSDPNDSIFSYQYGSIEQFQELVARFPKKAAELHCKLLARSKRTNSDEIYENRQKKAEEKRQQILNDKAAKMRELLQRVEEVRQAQIQIIEERKSRINEKLKRAEENRNSYLNTIKKKAHDEEEKLKEIAFINELEAQNRRHDSLALRQEQEERIQTIMEERQRKVDEKAAKEAAVGERKRVLEAERQEKIELMQQKRRQKEEIIGKKQQEKELERKVTAREKAREREERLLAREAAHMANVKELQDKILKKQESSARRHEENINHIRQKALEAGMLRCSASDEVPDCKKPGPTELKKMSSLQELNEGPSKSQKKKYKKIRSRLLKRESDSFDAKKALTITFCDSDSIVSMKRKLSQLNEILCDQFNSYTHGPTFGELETLLNDLSELVNASSFSHSNFHAVKGFEVFDNVLLRLTNSARTACFNRLAKKMSAIFLAVCKSSNDSCCVFMMGSTICELMESLNILLADLLYSKTKQGNLTVEITGQLIILLHHVLSGVREYLDVENLDYNILLRRIRDVISFVMCSGLMQKFIDILKFTSQQEPDKGCLFKPLVEPLLNLLKEMVHPPLCSKEYLDVLESTDLLGTVSLLYGHLLNTQSIPPFTEAIILFFRSIGSLHLSLFQKILGAEGISLQFRFIASYILNSCSNSTDSVLQSILNYVILLIGYFSTRNLENQVVLQSGQFPTVLQQLLSLPFKYFCDPQLQFVLYPTLIALCDGNVVNRELLENELSYEHITHYMKRRLDPKDFNSFYLTPSLQSVKLDNPGVTPKTLSKNKKPKDQSHVHQMSIIESTPSSSRSEESKESSLAKSSESTNGSTNTSLKYDESDDSSFDVKDIPLPLSSDEVKEVSSQSPKSDDMTDQYVESVKSEESDQSLVLGEKKECSPTFTNKELLKSSLKSSKPGNVMDWYLELLKAEETEDCSPVSPRPEDVKESTPLQ